MPTIGPDGRVRFDSPDDLPPVAMSLASTAWNATGAWRSREPVFGDIRPPCAVACLAGEDIVDQMRLFAQGRVAEAGELMLRSNPFPGTTGRVCPHPCTRRCNRETLDGAVDVPGVERAIGDALLAAWAAAPRAKPAGARVAIVGAGPAGMAAADFLAREGFGVTLFDREEAPGGLLRGGIPPYRLPRDVLDRECRRALAGVLFEGGRALGRDVQLAALAREHDAVLVAIGRHGARPLGVPGEDARGVVDGLGLLAAIHRGGEPPAGARAVVVGGGNTAFDCARTLVRAGRAATIAYRRDRGAMPAFADEIEEAIEEGVAIVEWAPPVGVAVEGGRARAVRFVRARAGAPDASGRPRPEPIAGSEFAIDADLVVVAAGEGLEAGAVPGAILRDGFVGAGKGFATSMERVFACGDCAGGGGTVADAIGQGRRAAAAIAKALGASGPDVDLLAARGAADGIAGPERIRGCYFAPVPPHARARVAPERRRDGVEVRAGFDAAAARAEAARCLACGTCTGCDNCFHFCADRAVIRGAPGAYAVDTSRCKGCGVCVEECPRGAVVLREIGGGDGD